MKDALARQLIKELAQKIGDLQASAEYYEPTAEPVSIMGYSSLGGIMGCQSTELRLTARDIINRFDELYKYLGVTRQTTTSETKTELKKVKP